MESDGGVLDELIDTHVVDAGDLAQITGATSRSVSRWTTAKAIPGVRQRTGFWSSKRWYTSSATTQLGYGCVARTLTSTGESPLS
jgi:hypothetical protein